MADDFRWLIEAPGPRYLAVQNLSSHSNFVWLKDHDAALAFRSKEQAESVRKAVRHLMPELFAFERAGLDAATAVEHGWIEPRPDAALSATPQ